MKKILIGLKLIFIISITIAQTPKDHVVQVQQSLAKGWNTWDTYSRLYRTRLSDCNVWSIFFKNIKNKI